VQRESLGDILGTLGGNCGAIISLLQTYGR
jgi:hypothetical protein